MAQSTRSKIHGKHALQHSPPWMRAEQIYDSMYMYVRPPPPPRICVCMHAQAAGVTPSPSDSVRWHRGNQPFQEQARVTGFLTQEVGGCELRRREEAGSREVGFPTTSRELTHQFQGGEQTHPGNACSVLWREAGRMEGRAGPQHQGCVSQSPGPGPTRGRTVSPTEPSQDL